MGPQFVGDRLYQTTFQSSESAAPALFSIDLEQGTRLDEHEERLEVLERQLTEIESKRGEI